MREPYERIAAGLKDALDIVDSLTPIDPAVAEGMGEAVARIMGFDAFTAFKAAGTVDATEADLDTRGSCIDDGLFLLRYLRTIGFDVVKLETPAHA